jgi:hypothetical protein
MKFEGNWNWLLIIVVDDEMITESKKFVKLN